MKKRHQHSPNKKSTRKIRYAVVGLGYISQAAVLPAFRHAAENSVLTALVSDDPIKLQALGRKYKVSSLYSYDEYEDCLKNGEIDAVYIALPNSMHADFTIRAARAGVHVLCEKPMAITERDCLRMIQACQSAAVKLMIAYRLHFEKTNLEAMERARSGELGDLRFFNASFSMQVRPKNIRLSFDLGGGPMLDLGIYCLNAARYLFRAEPIEVMAMTANNGEARFKEVEEMMGALLRFPGERLATLTCSFGAADTSTYQLVGTQASLRVEQSFKLADSMTLHQSRDGKTHTRRFPKRDQFAPELIYFSQCVLEDKIPEPSGIEGLADVRVIQALYRSAQTGRTIFLDTPSKKASSKKLKNPRSPKSP